MHYHSIQGRDFILGSEKVSAITGKILFHLLGRKQCDDYGHKHMSLDSNLKHCPTPFLALA